ncbi:hypothetical protein FACS189427_08350 [Planctomycetales bacterium]|nr:hypothetical protein FACS189427_08350 [Planctomycetales bacterium]
MIILYPGYSFETLATDCSADDAGQLLAYWSAAFHPALLEKYGEIPRWESASMPPYSADSQPVCVPPCCESYLNDDWVQQQQNEGGLIVRELKDRCSITEKLFQLAGINEDSSGFDDEYTANCRSLATAYFLTDLLVRQLHYMSMMDDSQCSGVLFDSIKAYREGNRDCAYDCLRQAFEAVCQSKEYFYPIHSYFIDLTLITPASVNTSVPRLLNYIKEQTADRRRQTEAADGNEGGSKVQFNFFLPGKILNDLAAQPSCNDTITLLKEHCQTQTVQIIADNAGEVSLMLLPLFDAVKSIINGKSIYQNVLNVQPVIYGRLHTGLTTFLPQILKLAGYKGVIFFAPLDGWQSDEKAQSKILWQGSDGTKIDALVRYPLNASEDSSFFELAEKLGETINNDNVPTTVFARFPNQYAASQYFTEQHCTGQNQTASFWADDLQRMSRFTNDLGEFVSLEKYFDETANTGAVKRFGTDVFQLKVPFDVLSESVQQKIANPVLRWNEVWKNSAEKNIRSAFTTVLTLLGRQPALSVSIGELIKLFAEVLSDKKTDSSAAGMLVFNPWSFPRRVFLDISHWESLPEDTQPIVLAKETDEAKEIIVDIPPLGYVFIQKPAEQIKTEERKQTAKSGGIFGIFNRPKKDETDTLIRLVKNTVKDKDGKETIQDVYLLQNEFFNVKIDAATGVLRSLFTEKSRYNQLSQQIAFRLPKQERLKDGRGTSNPNYGYAVSTADSITVEQSGPVTGRLQIQGRLICPDGSLAAQYNETVIIRRKSRLLEFHLHLETKPKEQNIEEDANPQDSYFTLRRAWNDMSLELRAGIADGLEPINTGRIIAPRLLDLRRKDTEQSLTFLTEGLPFHRLIGGHQLDTILAVPQETSIETTLDFRYGIGVDMKFPVPAAMEFLAPKAELIQEVNTAPQNNSSWLFHIEAKNVVALNWEPFFDESSTSGKPAGFCVLLLETENRRAHFELKSFLEPVKAAATDFFGNELKPLKTENSSVLIDMHGRELMPIQIWI